MASPGDRPFILKRQADSPTVELYIVGYGQVEHVLVLNVMQMMSVNDCGVLERETSAMGNPEDLEVRHFDCDLIRSCVRWFLRFKLSL